MKYENYPKNLVKGPENDSSILGKQNHDIFRDGASITQHKIWQHALAYLQESCEDKFIDINSCRMSKVEYQRKPKTIRALIKCWLI